MAESEEELKSLLMRVKEESEKADFKLNIQITKITASGPIISWTNRWGNSDRLYFEPKKIKSVTVTIVFQSIYHEVTGPDAMILVFSMLSFKPTFSLSFFTFIKRFFSSSSLSTIKVASSAYLRLSYFSWQILIPACD